MHGEAFPEELIPVENETQMQSFFFLEVRDWTLATGDRRYSMA